MAFRSRKGVALLRPWESTVERKAAIAAFERRANIHEAFLGLLPGSERQLSGIQAATVGAQ